jgi:DNA-binding transcriptional LysR family regulator
MKPFDINLLLTLSALLQTQSVSRAAKRMGVSQPTVSRALGELRRLLSDPLLIRAGSGMALTQRGMELAKPLEEWMAMTATMLRPTDFDPATLDRSFSVAATDYGMLSVISPVLPSIGTAAPGCRIDISGYTDDMFRELASGDLDLIIHGFRPDISVAHARHLFTETQSIIVRPHHPLLQKAADRLSITDYLAWPHVAISIGTNAYDHVQHCLGERGADRRVMVRLPYFYAAPDLIGGSDAVLTMPTRAAAKFAQLHGFACLRAPLEISDFDYWVVWHERSARDPATLWLIDMLCPAQSPASIAGSIGATAS